MGAFSPFHGLGFLIGLFLIGFPVFKIFQKAGYSGWWVLPMFVPLANLIGLWIFALSRWPNQKASTADSASEVF